jgi:hypothetical protein
MVFGLQYRDKVSAMGWSDESKKNKLHNDPG